MGEVIRKTIISEFHLLEEKAKYLRIEQIEAYLIGGGNLALRRLKSATKDIDVVILTRERFNSLQKLLETHVPHLPVYTRRYKSEWSYDLGMSAKYNHPVEGFGIDVFVKRIFNRLYLSRNISGRSEVPKEFEHHELFKIYLVSKEDLFLFKSVTSMERTRDVEDLITLVETGLNYNVIVQELENQLSKDISLKNLVPPMIERVEFVMQQSGTVTCFSMVGFLSVF